MRSPTVLAGVALACAFAAYLLLDLLRGLRQESAVAQYAGQIFRSPTSFVAGNPAGDASVVAFFDYNCPYCRNNAPALANLIARDPKIRLVLKELPMLGADSEAVARLALAARVQGQYYEMHRRLITEPGRATPEKALRIAAALGLDAEKLTRDSQEDAVQAILAENSRLADRLGIQGVPFYLVGDRVLPAAEDFPKRLAEAVAEIRRTGCRAEC